MKIYKVTFREYLTEQRKTVANGYDGSYFTKYLNAKDLLITERQIKKYEQYGGGYEKIEFVGNLDINE